MEERLESNIYTICRIRAARVSRIPFLASKYLSAGRLPSRGQRFIILSLSRVPKAATYLASSINPRYVCVSARDTIFLCTLRVFCIERTWTRMHIIRRQRGDDWYLIPERRARARRGEREARKARLHANLRLISGGGGGYLGYLLSSRSRTRARSSFFSLLENKDWKHVLFFDNKRFEGKFDRFDGK